MNINTINEITEKSPWAWSHGADDMHPGFGLIYYSLVYSYLSEKCVILGSGGGYIPRIIYYAQSELLKNNLINKIDISLVDAGNGVCGNRLYDEHGFEDLKELKLYNNRTDDVFNEFNDINYLHVDADHSPNQVYADLCNYGSRMNKDNWIITCHDTHFKKDIWTNSDALYKSVARWSDENNYNHINFNIGRGTTLIMPNIGGLANSDYQEMVSDRIKNKNIN